MLFGMYKSAQFGKAKTTPNYIYYSPEFDTIVDVGFLPQNRLAYITMVNPKNHPMPSLIISIEEFIQLAEFWIFLDTIT
jgi:hypothetical protein